MLLWRERRPGRGRTSRLGCRSGPGQLRPHPLGRCPAGVLGGMAVLVGPGPGGAGRRPSSTCWLRGGTSTLPAASLASAAGHTFVYAAPAGLIATVAAVPVALLSVRFPRRQVRFLERANMLVLAVPGLVIALSLTFFTEHYLAGQPLPDPAAAGPGLRRHVLPDGRGGGAGRRGPVPGRVGGGRAARSGVRRRTVFWRVTLPLIGPGLAAASAWSSWSRPPSYGHPGPHPDQRADPGHPVLGLPDQRLLRPGRALRRHDGAHRRGPELCPRPLVRPPAGPVGDTAGRRTLTGPAPSTMVTV